MVDRDRTQDCARESSQILCKHCCQSTPHLKNAQVGPHILRCNPDYSVSVPNAYPSRRPTNVQRNAHFDSKRGPTTCRQSAGPWTRRPRGAGTGRRCGRRGSCTVEVVDEFLLGAVGASQVPPARAAQGIDNAVEEVDVGGRPAGAPGAECATQTLRWRSNPALDVAPGSSGMFRQPASRPVGTRHGAGKDRPRRPEDPPEVHKFRHLMRAPLGDRAVSLVAFALTVLVDLPVAIEVGSFWPPSCSCIEWRKSPPFDRARRSSRRTSTILSVPIRHLHAACLAAFGCRGLSVARTTLLRVGWPVS